VNLFHSFGQFNVPMNNIANFLNDSGLATSNILARVTGMNGSNPTLSSIYGTIQTTGFGNANLFLLNPAGFLFGPNATLNVGGMMTFTSADYLRLADGVRFNAIPNPAADALLSAAPVAAFGFLGSHPGAITVQGSQLSVADGTGISLVGGNITIQSGAPDNGTVQPARLSATNGQINLASTASPGEFLVGTLQPAPNVNGQSFTSYGAVSLAPGSTVDVSQTGSGTVSIRGGQFVLSVSNAVLTTAENPASTVGQDTIVLNTGSSIVSATSGADSGADVQIVAGTVQMDAASIQSTTTGNGQGGGISISADTVSLTNGAQIVSSTTGAGAGGNITLSAIDSVSISGYDTTGTVSGVTTFFSDLNTGLPLVTSGVFSTTSGSGPGGSVTINAGTATLDNAGTLASITSGDGRGGDLTLNVRNLNIQNGGLILSSAGLDFTTFEFTGNGRAGDITVTAQESIQVSGFNPNTLSESAIWSMSNNTGDGGNITLSSHTVSVENGGIIQSTGSGPGNAGNIAIATDQVTVSGVDEIENSSTIISFGTGSGNSGAINITAQSVNVEDLGVIQTGGKEGNVTIQAGQSVNVAGGGVIASVGGANGSGDITISADQILISGMQGFSRSRIETFTGGQAATGKINLNVRDIIVTDGARINTVALGNNTTGGIHISATESVTVSDGGKIRSAPPENTTNPGRGGPIEITAPTITLDQGVIQALTIGSGNAGSVTLNADNVTLAGSFINTQSQQAVSGRGGDITINVTDKLLISGRFTGSGTDFARPAGIYADTLGTNQGGDISVTAGNLVSLSSTGAGLYSQTLGSSGNGGAISVQAPQVQLIEGAIISTKTTRSGNAGNIIIGADTFSMTGGANITAASTGSGAAGTVTIEGTASPAQSILIDGAGSGIFTTTSGTGAGGNIFLNANTVTLQNGGTLSAATSGTSPSATGGTITVHANTVELLSGATMTAQSTGSGTAGDITVQGLASPAQSISIDSPGSGVLTEAHGTGNGGNITASAHQVQLTNQAKLSATTTGAGDAGNILVQGDTVSLLSGARIESGSIKRTPTAPAPTGQGGTVTVEGVASPATSIVISGQGSGIFTTAEGSGPGGNIAMTASQSVTLTDGASVAASSTGPANAGNIAINAGNSFFMQDSSVTTSATQASGGDISVQASSLFRLINSQMTASVQQGSQTVGGNITIDPNFVILQNHSQILATAVEGTGGNILIVTPVFFADQTSVVDASSQFGRSGTVTIQSPTSQLAGTLATLPQSVRQAAALTTLRCAAQMGGQVSSFVVAGRDTLPAEPGGWLMSQMALGSPLTLPLSHEGERGTINAGEGERGLSGPGQIGDPSHQIDPIAQTDPTPILSLRRMTPAGFLTQAFMVEGAAGCGS
jgi:filamentous hemagglutinin family protein